MSNLKDILGVGKSVIEAVNVLGSGSESVPESVPKFTGGAAAQLSAMLPETPQPGLLGLDLPFYVPPVKVDESELRQQANIKASFTLSQIRLGSSLARNFVAELIVSTTDKTLVENHRLSMGIVEPGSALAKAQKRIQLADKLKTHESIITSDDAELVEIIKEALFLDFKEQAQRGTYKKMDYSEMISKLIQTEFFSLAESAAEPLAEIAKAAIVKK